MDLQKKLSVIQRELDNLRDKMQFQPKKEINRGLNTNKENRKPPLIKNQKDIKVFQVASNKLDQINFGSQQSKRSLTPQIKSDNIKQMVRVNSVKQIDENCQNIRIKDSSKNQLNIVQRNKESIYQKQQQKFSGNQVRPAEIQIGSSIQKSKKMPKESFNMSKFDFSNISIQQQNSQKSLLHNLSFQNQKSESNLVDTQFQENLRSSSQNQSNKSFVDGFKHKFELEKNSQNNLYQKFVETTLNLNDKNQSILIEQPQITKSNVSVKSQNLSTLIQQDKIILFSDEKDYLSKSNNIENNYDKLLLKYNNEKLLNHQQTKELNEMQIQIIKLQNENYQLQNEIESLKIFQQNKISLQQEVTTLKQQNQQQMQQINYLKSECKSELGQTIDRNDFFINQSINQNEIQDLMKQVQDQQKQIEEFSNIKEFVNELEKMQETLIKENELLTRQLTRFKENNQELQQQQEKQNKQMTDILNLMVLSHFKCLELEETSKKGIKLLDIYQNEQTIQIETILEMLKKKQVVRDDQLLKSNTNNTEKILLIISKISSLIYNCHINLDKQITKNLDVLSYNLQENQF